MKKRCSSTFLRVSWPKKENIPRCSIEQVQLTFTRTSDPEIRAVKGKLHVYIRLWNPNV